VLAVARPLSLVVRRYERSLKEHYKPKRCCCKGGDVGNIRQSLNWIFHIERPWIAALLTLVAVPMAVGVAIFSLEEMSKIHWGVGAVFAVFFSAGVWLGLREMATIGQTYSVAKGIRIFLAMPLVAAVIAAWCAFELASHKVATYDPSPGSDLAAFFAYFFWLLLDMLPGLEVTKTLKWSAPANPADAMAGVPIVGFRLFVLLILLNALRRWWAAKERISSKSNTANIGAIPPNPTVERDGPQAARPSL
jgi:hypothetical protein